MWTSAIADFLKFVNLLAMRARRRPPCASRPPGCPPRARAVALALLLGTASPTAGFAADTAADAPGNFNPLVPGYFADPTIERFDDTFYLYATTDGNGGGRGPATVWVSRDFANWVLVPMNWPTTPHYWAPDVVRRPNGRYYLYYNQPCITYGAASDSPLGPWTPLTPGEGVVIPDRLVKDVITLDTQVFEDTDGTLYGYWGTWGIFPNSGCGFGVFQPDMKSFARLGMIPNTQAKDFFEAPFMIERHGWYYLTYSSGSCHDASYRVQYAVGRRPDGEFAMGPNNPILATTADRLIHGPGHHSILQQGDDYYIVYHRHDVPYTPNGMHRQTCADRLVFESDGVIRKIEPTHRGIGLLGAPTPERNLAFTAKVSASSFYRDTVRGHDYQPEYAVDDNNATLWRPANNRMGHWLTVDLGSPRHVRRTHVQFEYATWYYQYVLETSLDGRTWETFADRRQNTRWGSPMVDDGDVEARFVRLTVTGTEFPGLFGAVWNFKVFSEAPADPLLAMADRAFQEWVAPKQAGRTAALLQGPDRTRRGAPGEHDSELRAPSSELRLQERGTLEQEPAPNLLVHLDVADLPLGTSLVTWTNRGTLGGGFAGGDASPIVGLAMGRKAVRFSGHQLLTASFPAPRSLAGNSSFTVAAWVNNPEIGESECLVSWAGRGGPDATTAQVGYGTHREFGAVGHWGFADMGFQSAPPKAGQWHHLAVVFDGVIERVYVDGRLDNAAAKMLLMHAGRPIHVGASEPGTEFFDGYLASLRIYDGALPETEIQKLAADEPSADVLVHLDSARLDYGPLPSWANSGALGGSFSAVDQPPVVAEVDGRIAVQLGAGQSLRCAFDEDVALTDFTLLVNVANRQVDPGESVVEVEDASGAFAPLLSAPPGGGWRQLVVVHRDGGGTFFLDGMPTTRMVPRVPKSLRSIRLGGRMPFSGALSRVQLLRRALSVAEVTQWYQLSRQEHQAPAPNPSAFAQPPRAMAGTMIAMAARPGESAAGPVEYRFTETTGHPGGSSRGWMPLPYFLDDGLQPATAYAYNVQVRDAFGNVSVTSASVEAVTDPRGFQESGDSFDAAHDFLARGTSGTTWDGFVGSGDRATAEAIAAAGGALRLQSRGSVWDGGRPLGPFLYRLVAGDFVAQVKVVDYAGLSTRRVPGNNDGGLMARVPNPEDAGPGEDLVQLNFFPIWNQGNMVTTLDGGRLQKGNQLAWDAHRHLQIIRHGMRFHFRTSADGDAWQEMPGSPVERRDMANLPVQVGLYHASYGGESSHVAFADFRITTPKPAAEAPRPGGPSAK